MRTFGPEAGRGGEKWSGLGRRVNGKWRVEFVPAGCILEAGSGERRFG